MYDRATLPSPAPAAMACWQNYTRTFPGRPDQIRHARALLADFLDGFPLTGDALLLVSELATNAVTHSASGQPGGTFTIRARRYRDCLDVEIEDQGSTWDGRLAPATAPHGHYLLRALAAGCRTLPGPSGWITWFTLTPAPHEGPTPMTHDTTAYPHTPTLSTRLAGQHLTNQLLIYGFGAQARLWDGTCTLTIIGAQQARSCLTIDDDGGLRWEYEPRPGPRTSPAALTRIILHILGAAPADDQPLDDHAYPAFLLKGATGRLAQDHGLKAELLTYEDLESFDVIGEISITSPSRPERGAVRVTDDGFLAWGCQAQQAFTGGPGAIIPLIAPILRQPISARPGPPPDRDGHPTA